VTGNEHMRACWERLKQHHPPWVLGVFTTLFVLGSVLFFTVKTKHDTPTVLVSGDGRYYWAYLASLGVDGDLDFSNQYANPRCGNYWGYGKTPTGKYANAFTLGPALLWMPFFLVARGVSAIVEPGRALEGTSDLIQLITLYGSFLYAFAAMLFAYELARRRFGPGPAVAGAAAGLLCGPVLQYALQQPSFSHAPSAFAVATLWFAWDTGRGARTLRGWLLLGALIGLAMLVRAQNLVFALPVVVEGLQRLASARRAGGRAFGRAAVAPLLGALMALVVFLPQLWAWKSLYGFWLGVPQGRAYMRFGESLWMESLFSSRHGLFPYAPLWAAGLLGLLLLCRRDRALGLTLLGTFALMAYLNGAVADWWAIGSIGGRRYDGLLVHASLGIATLVFALAAAVVARPRATCAVLVATVVGLSTLFSYGMVRDYQLHGRFGERDATDTLSYYNTLLLQAGRSIWKGGNPLSWPGAWAFAWKTGLPPSRYDELVGPYFLVGFDASLGDFQKRAAQEKAALVFGEAKHQKFLLSGFGDSRKEGAKSVRPATSERARVAVPLNNAGGVGMRLVGEARELTSLRILWNGHEVAYADLLPNAPIDVAFVLDDEQVKRGLNFLELVHLGGVESVERALYRELAMETLP
jgi:hypothetical protein